MSDSKKIDEFPEIDNKLAAPSKKSLFERQKAEAEAKRLREEAETAAVYEDFVKSFDDSDGTYNTSGTGRRLDGSIYGATSGAGSGSGGPSRRHFAGARGGLSSGPGSLGPPPPSLARKRALESSQASQRD